MAENYLIAHDLGTSGVKAALTDLSGQVIATAESRYRSLYQTLSDIAHGRVAVE